ncbi:phenoloxidase-activating factor 2-like [Ischnura elegans]|uniref:phenoloxidase-activating factor 2-like n=1 Tax=Ischnura elegans TaxID=197161 RepID=UPI001ED8AFCD|nr:phenoloxidase-activating factor 2-like [Ischnura elegans]
MRVLSSFLAISALLVLSAAQESSLDELFSEDVPKNCSCIPYYQCFNGSAIDDGASLIDVRIKPLGCENYLEVCCATPPMEMDPEAEFQGDVYSKDRKGTCGVLNPNGVAFRIMGATNSEAQFGEFPWMTAVLQPVEARALGEEEREEGSTETVLKYLCGGSLIHPKVVLTGAHCVASFVDSPLTIRAGEWDSRTSKEIYRHQDRGVSKVVVHPQFKSGNLFNDVALLFLSEPVKPAKHIGFVCLPDKNLLPPPATICLASGWGKDAFGKEGKYSSILKRLDLPIVSHAKCQHNLRKTRLGYYFRLHESFICAGGEKGKDTCKGDGGGPLVCPHPHNPERYMQSGIVAWGIGCMKSHIPGVYANVAHFRDWIDENMKEHNLDTTYYSL